MQGFLRSASLMSGVLAVLLFASQSARATHGTQLLVDEIEGDGPGVYFGSFPGTAGGDTADWYMFAAAAGGFATIETTAGTFDTTLELYLVSDIPTVGDLRDDPEYTEVAFNDDGGVGLLSLISIPLAAGNYIVAVEQFGDGGGDYTLSISGEGLGPVGGVIPEPTSVAMAGTGLLALLGLGLRRFRRATA